MEILVAEKSFTVGPATAGQVAAVAAAYAVLGPALKSPEEFDTLALLGALPAANTALAAVLGCPVSDLEALPLHDYVRVARETWEAFITVNADYFARQVVPAVRALADSVIASAGVVDPEALFPGKQPDSP